MARVFLSHSSKDKTFVRRLAEDLAAMGHEPWLDEWEIRVGECIVTKVEHGIAEADCVVLVLTPNAVASGWVDREWKAKYWTEIEGNKTFVLPVMVEDCVVPVLLHTRKYADFRKSFAIGFHELAVAIGKPLIKATSSDEPSDVLPHGDSRSTALLAKVHARQAPLAACIAEALQIASMQTESNLRLFCERELSGYAGLMLDKDAPQFPRYRLVRTFCSLDAQVNFGYFGWGESGANIIRMLEGDPENFTQVTTFMPQPISEVEQLAERDGSKGVLHWTRSLGDLTPGAATPDHPVQFYASGDTFRVILEAARSELTRLLLASLPGTAAPPTIERTP